MREFCCNATKIVAAIANVNNQWKKKLTTAAVSTTKNVKSREFLWMNKRMNEFMRMYVCRSEWMTN